jgi:molybdopterin molybdotransferase
MGAELSIEQAREFLSSLTEVVRDVERVSLSEALGRVLARDLVAPIDVPPCDNSAMDGYALASSSVGPYRVIGSAHAGKPFQGDVGAGECVRILTGALVPRGCDAIVMQERARLGGDLVTIEEPIRPGQNVRPAGEDFAKGSVALARGRVLRPTDIAVAASFGLSELQVWRRPNVGYFSTGDELVPAHTPLEPGKLYDSNRALVGALLTRAGANPVDLGHAGDDERELRAIAERGARSLDVILSTGGVAVGDADCVCRALGARSIEVAMKPGRHLAAAKIDRCAFIGLPGNPVAVVATFDALVRPVLEHVMGAAPRERLRLRAKLTSPVRNAHARVDFQRGVLSRQSDGTLVVRSTGHQGAGIMRSLVLANCFIVLGPRAGELGPGAMVDVEPFQEIERL